jgi:hypothetical protein
MIWSKNLKRRNHLRNVDTDEQKVLKWIWEGGCGLDSSGKRQDTMGSFFEHGNETCVYIKPGQLFDQLNT